MFFFVNPILTGSRNHYVIYVVGRFLLVPVITYGIIKKHKRLSLKERVIIQTLLEENKFKSFIAKKLNRSRSTIAREVNKWVS